MTVARPLPGTPVFEWTTVADQAGAWLRVGGVVDALVVRPVLGAEVEAVLARSMLRAPIIEVSGGDWIFLTGRRTPLRQSTWDGLARIPVGWREAGSYVRLPRTDEVACDLSWRHRHVPGAPLPPWTSVVCAIRSVVA